jgi:hypothetical protein
MIKPLKNEKWKELRMPKGALRFRYAVSNLGRIASFSKNIKDGKILKGTTIGGYPTLNIKPFGENKTYYIHKLVAENFLKKKGRKQQYVIHKNHDKLNNKSNNLKWADKDEMHKHQQKSPLVIKSREERMNRPIYEGHKLTAKSVKQIKKQIFNPNRRLTMREIAEKYGISEMQLYRIKSGENWGHVKV